MKRIIEYYRKIVELESRRGLNIQNYYGYPINYKEDNNRILLVDLQQDEAFFTHYNQNSNVQYPQNLFVGIGVLYGDESYKLFNTIIEYADLDQNVDDNVLTHKIASFEVNVAELERMEIVLSDPEICELNRIIREESTIEAIELAVREIFRTNNINIESKIYLALCSDSRALSQIYSELRSERLINVISNNCFAKEFITNSPFENKIDSIDEDSLISVTDLDEYQKKSIKFALENRLSVITGPPGTGKTQVILNLLANALIKNKRVLVVSKNNKAVENVKDRYDALDNYHYLLRFGYQNLIANSTIPEINRLLNIINREDDGDNFVLLQNEYNSLVHQISLAKGNLIRMAHRETQINEYEQKIEVINCRIRELEVERENALNELILNNEREESLNNLEINGYLSDLRLLNNLIQEKFCGTFGFLYNSFCSKKYARILFDKIERYPIRLRNYVIAYLPHQSVKFVENGNDLLKTIELLCVGFNNISKYRNIRDNLVNDYVTVINGLKNERHLKESELKSIRREYYELREREDELRTGITQAKKKIKSMSIPLINAYTLHNINERNSRDIVTYRGYLPGMFYYNHNNLVHSTMSFLNTFKLNCVTSLSVKNSFPMISEMFDMIIVDEASQCDIATIIPMIARTKQLVVIGDPQQLKHISNINANEESEIKRSLGLGEMGFLSYVGSSLWDYCSVLIDQAEDGMRTPFRLNNHYRCHAEIIGFSNNEFYGHDGPLNICTNIENENMGMGIHWVNISGIQINENIKINVAEAQKCVEIARNTINLYPDKSMGIITPFRRQAEYIYNIVRELNLVDRITVSTVHKYQGDEKDVIILSLVVTNNTPDGTLRWIDEYNKHLINVAVTRAKRVLCIVGNKEYIRGNSRGVLRRLVAYVNRLSH